MSRSFLAVSFALVAAVLFALSSVMQHHAAARVDSSHSSLKLIRRLLVSRLWLLARGLGLIGLVLQAFALSKGSLILVQATLTSGVVVALTVEARLNHRSLSPGEVFGSLLIVSGVALIVGVARPHGTRTSATPAAWLLASLIAVLACALIIEFAGRHGTGVRSQGRILAIGAGIVFGLDAGFLKASSTLGWRLSILAPLAGYLVAAVAGNIIIQRAFHVAPFSSSLPALTATEPLASVVFGFILFHETFEKTTLAKIGGVVGVMLVVLGVVVSSKMHRLLDQQDLHRSIEHAAGKDAIAPVDSVDVNGVCSDAKGDCDGDGQIDLRNVVDPHDPVDLRE